MKVYSVVLNWQDNDPEQGTFGATVRAEDEDQAVLLARREMWLLEGDGEFDPVDWGDSVVEVSEGASWKAAEMERVLRGLLDTKSVLHDVLESASTILAEIDALPGPEALVDA